MMRFVVVGDQELVAKLVRVPNIVKERLSVILFRAMVAAQRIVKQDKLSGQVLHRRTSHLSDSVISNPLGYMEGDALVGFFGVPEGPTAVYGKVHEFGGTFDIPAHLQRNPGGRAARLTRPGLLSEEQRKAVPGGYHMVRAHKATYPERSFIRSTFREIRATLMTDLQRGVAEGAGSAS